MICLTNSSPSVANAISLVPAQLLRLCHIDVTGVSVDKPEGEGGYDNLISESKLTPNVSIFH